MIISFECYCPLKWGQTLFLTGSLPELANWDSERAIPLTAIANDKWRTALEMSDSSALKLSYKYFIKNTDGSITWEPGKNRTFELNTTKYGNWNLRDLWQNHDPLNDVYTKSAFTKVVFKRNESDLSQYNYPAKAKSMVAFKVLAPQIGIHSFLAISGNCEPLGNWDKANLIPLNASEFPYWKLAIPADKLPQTVEYKYVIVNRITGNIESWEWGDNRFIYVDEKSNDAAILVNDNTFRFSEKNFKGAGVSLPVFSIRTAGSFGVGDFLDIKMVVDWAKKTGLKMIQVLPLNDTISTYSFLDSYPYKAISVFALHPLYLNLFKMGQLTDADKMAEFMSLQTRLNSKESIDYDLVIKLKLSYAKTLFLQKPDQFLKSKGFTEFFSENKSWLEPYGAFCYLRDTLGNSDFNQWKAYSSFNAPDVRALFQKESEAYYTITFWYFIQYHLHVQLSNAAEYARNHGVVLKGDIPIGISRNSVDAWFQPGLYHFDGQAGAPPDDFSADGQNWGFPTYNWETMAQNNYQWWRNRLTKMAEYFDAYRIDHILGFFRIWEIPIHAVQGILGHFRPALPYTRDELAYNGIWFDFDRMCKPYIRGHFLPTIFNQFTDEVIDNYLVETGYNIFELRNEFGTQQQIYNHFVESNGPEGLGEKDKTIMWGLIRLAADVLFLPADDSNQRFHPRISLHSTYAYQELDGYLKERINQIYTHYFYHRHEQYWKEQAIEKLPALVNATDMLICGEDLGMIPASVPDVMNQFGILSLEIQRMPKDARKNFAHPADAPFMSVCTTSTHDMSTLRGWWEEDRIKTKLFYREQMGRLDEMPYFAEPWICKDILLQHLHSPAMWTVFPIQDLLAMDENLRNQDTHSERINEPANPRHFWKYRLHLSMEELLQSKKFNETIKEMVKTSGRGID